MNERLQWFRDRIGKRVFRNSFPCECEACERIKSEGLLIEDQDQAELMRDMEGCSGEEGEPPLYYFDTREEVEEFEKQLKLKEI